ncbi:MAG TPA: hypothetical protein VKE74_32390 [Gemmataceae bacterium]|nr:hypothetical protein [Gemmataceae bacterium]
MVLALAVGCGDADQPPRRGTIQGKVTLDGKPVAKANVRFIALEARGVNVLASVTDGVYQVPDGQGPTKGKYRVEFSVPSATSRRVQHPDNPGECLEERVETLPVRYHRDSQFVLDYDPDNPQPSNAELTSK